MCEHNTALVARIGRTDVWAGRCWDCDQPIQFSQGITLAEFIERTGGKIVVDEPAEVPEEVKV